MTDYTLGEAKLILEMLVGRESGFTTTTQVRDAARVVLDCLAEEPEWEYGVTSKWGIQETPTLHGANQYATHLRRSIESGRESGDLEYHGHVMRRTKAKAGPWVPVKQGADQ